MSQKLRFRVHDFLEMVDTFVFDLKTWNWKHEESKSTVFLLVVCLYPELHIRGALMPE